MFGAETRAVLEKYKPKRIIIVDCDAKIHRWEEIADESELEDKALGGGGTDFRPVFERIEEEMLEPDLMLYLTDGYGLFPSERPSYPVVWGSITDPKHVTYPWGDVVQVPQQDETPED